MLTIRAQEERTENVRLCLRVRRSTTLHVSSTLGQHHYIPFLFCSFLSPSLFTTLHFLPFGFLIFNALLHSYSIEEECWNVTITSRSRYFYSCTRDLRPYRVTHTRSLFPSVHTSYSD